LSRIFHCADGDIELAKIDWSSERRGRRHDATARLLALLDGVPVPNPLSDELSDTKALQGFVLQLLGKCEIGMTCATLGYLHKWSLGPRIAIDLRAAGWYLKASEIPSITILVNS